MSTLKRHRRRSLRRAAVIVQVAVMSTLMAGFASLTLDLGAMYTVQAELQSIADAAALAAASELVGDGSGTDPKVLAQEAAEEIALRNSANNEFAGIDVGDVEFGKATYDATTERFYFSPATSGVDAVRVTARRAGGPPGAGLKFTFAKVLGYCEADLSARATATLVPRDIVVVIDLSNSMCYDSELRYWDRSDGGYSNLRDIWCALDGPEPSIPYVPGSELETEYAFDFGPTYGLMTEWGDPLIPGYSPSTDPGLYYVKRYKDVYDSRLENSLISRGYTYQEREALLKPLMDGEYSSYRNRVKVLLGLADWSSGKYGAAFPGGGNGNDWIGDGELVNKVPAPDYALAWDWNDYVDRQVNGSSKWGFQYRYGLKTLTDFMMERYPSHYQTDVLWQTPEQPLRATKDAVQEMTNYIASLDSPDQMSLVIFASDSPPPEVYLTQSIQEVPSRLYHMQSGHYNRTTNIGAGINRARAELKSARTRSTAKKVIVVMSDGEANEGGDGYAPKDYARYQAELAVNEQMTIYTVSVGYGVDRVLMQDVAQIANGMEFYAAGNPEEYTEELKRIFRSLGGKRPVVLIE